MSEKPFYLGISCLEVKSWSPGAEGENIPCTQVHVVMGIADVDLTLITRLKSRAACDSLIAALIEHRDFVFPQDDPPTDPLLGDQS